MTTDVKMRLVGENKASAAIQQVKKDLAGLDKQAGAAAGGLSGLAKVAGAAGLVAFGVQAARAAVELAELGNASRSMKAAFEDVAGSAENATAIIEALQQASRGTIDEFSLMQAASKGVLLGVADTADEFSALMEIAIVRGKALGLSAQQAFSDLVTGLGRESALILDNLGIIVDVEAATKDYAATLGKTADQLTATERKQALVNEVIASSADLLRDANSNAKVYAGEGMAQLQTAWTDFRTTLGESLAPILEARAKELANFISGVNEALDALATEDRTVFAPQLANQQVTQAQAQLDALQKQLIDKTQNAQRQIQELVINPLDPNAFQQATEQYQRELDALVSSIKATQTELDTLLGKQQEVAKAATTQGRAAIAPDLQPTLSSASDAALFDTERQIQAALDLVKAANASFGEALRQGNTAAADVANGYINDLAPAIRTLVNQYNDLAAAQGRQRIVGVSYGNAEIIYQTVDALEAEKKAAEDVATALTIIGESDGKLQGLYDTLLDTGNIDGAAASFEAIKGVIADITTEWVSQGKSVEEIQGTLLPKLIAELDGVIAAQVEAGQAGVDSGALIGSGFLAAIPGIQAVIGIVNQLTGNVIAAGNAINTIQGFNLNAWQWKELGATGVRPPGLIGPAPRGVEKPRPGLAPIDNSGFGWFGAAADTFGGKTAADLQSERIRALAQNQRNLAAAASGGSGGGGGGSIDNEAQKLANRLTSILNGALKSGIDLDSILPRQDAIEEPARRLADIAVRGFDSPWVDYIKNTFPEIWGEIENAGDPKQAAANILRDFEDGLRPELLDKGRAKELVKRALLGEQNTAALAAEIAAELSSELGVSLQQAQEAAAGVLGSGTGTGTGDGTGMDGGVAAASFTDAFIGTMGAMLERFKGAGNSAGAQWGIGFMGAVEGGVPSQLIGLLVTLVTPGVMANMAAGSSRTGAS